MEYLNLSRSQVTLFIGSYRQQIGLFLMHVVQTASSSLRNICLTVSFFLTSFDRSQKFRTVIYFTFTVTVHSSFFPTFDLLKKYVAFCTAFNLLTLIFMLPCIIMDLPIFVIAEWATLLVDIRCPRGGS